MEPELIVGRWAIEADAFRKWDQARSRFVKVKVIDRHKHWEIPRATLRKPKVIGCHGRVRRPQIYTLEQRCPLRLICYQLIRSKPNE